MRKLLVIAALVLILIPIVSGLGVTPTRKGFEFEPEKIAKGSFTVMNSEQKDVVLEITTREEIADYIKVEASQVELKGGASKEISYELRMPASFEKPGLHVGEIVITRLASKGVEEGAFLDNIVSVVTQVRLRVPYPGLYAEGRLDITEANVNETVTFILPISNFGSQDISSAKGAISIADPSEKKLSEILTNEKSIKAKTTEELTTNWLAAVEPGVYTANATIKYDEKLFSLKKNFAVGVLLVELISATVKDFRPGGIAKITLGVKNRWNSKINNIYAILTVFDSKGTIISQTKSASIDLAGQQEGTIDTFWDTEGMPSGTYPANVSIHYADKKTEREMKLIVGSSGVYVQLNPVTGQAISENAGSIKASPISLILTIQVVFILAGLGLMFFLWRRLKRKP